MHLFRSAVSRRIAGLVTATALLAGSTVALAPAAAAAAPPPSFARLSITPNFDRPGYYNVVVWGHFNGGARVQIIGMRLKGDDPYFNDDLGVSRTQTAVDGDFSMQVTVWHGTLNEDIGRDEIFATVSTAGFSASTNNVNGYY